MKNEWKPVLEKLGRLSWSAGLTLTIIFGFILGACTTQQPTPVPATSPVPSPTADTSAVAPAEVSYEQVDLPEAGLTLEVPASWNRRGPDWIWTPAQAELPRLGVAWRDLQPPQEAEAALLPNPAQVLDSEPVDLGWGSGRRVTLEVYAPAIGNGDAQAPVQSVETHVLIVLQEGASRRGYDLYAAAQSAGELSAIEPMLEHLLDTAELDREAALETPATDRRLPAEEELEVALATSLVQDPAGLCEWALWGQAGQELYIWAVCEASSGSATSAPAVVVLSATGEVDSVYLPRDGAYQGPDIRDMFPADVQQRILASEFDAPAAMARIAERRAASQDIENGETIAVTVYFGNGELNPNIQDCRLVYPVVRMVAAPDAEDVRADLALARVALAELFAGPTSGEAEQGYISMFSAQTASILRSVAVEGKIAYVNLADIRQVIPSAGTSCGSQAFLAEMDQTVQAVLPVERVIYAIEGDPAAFYDWLQFGCSAANDFCDPAPFVQDGG